MQYLVTGATGFIGRFLVERLLRRADATVHALTRPGSEYKLERLREQLGVGADRLQAVHGDLQKPLLGLDEGQREGLRGRVDHFFHLAAIYDITQDAPRQHESNVEGTRQAQELAFDLQAGCFQYASSIAVAGAYPGTFTEEMFGEANDFPNPYLLTKHEAERVVREECRVPYRIYRPSMVVGHSETGEIDKADGPYYMFPVIRMLRKAVPPSVTLPAPRTRGLMNLVPVDFVADAMDWIAHLSGRDGETFFLTDSHHYGVHELLHIFSRAAGGPSVGAGPDVSPLLDNRAARGLLEQPAVRQNLQRLLNPLGIPVEILDLLELPTRFDNRNTREALTGSGIEVPSLQSYAGQLWRYWRDHLAPADAGEGKSIQLGVPDVIPHFRRAVDNSVAGLRYRLTPQRALQRRVEGKVVVITGASSDIGGGLARRLARAGATVAVTARSAEKLEDLVDDIRSEGGSAHAYRCDIADPDSVDAFCRQVLADHGQVDILVNNAGRSIRRSIKRSFDRYHDYERTMQLNYFGAIRMAMNLLPQMRERRGGHIINVSTVGVQNAPPRFSAYLGSKFALEGWTMAAATEFVHENIHFSLVNYPLVRTPMIAPTKIYDYFPALSPEQAVNWLCEVIVKRPKRKTTPFGLFSLFMYYAFPKTAEFIVNTGYQVVPETFGKGGKNPNTSATDQPVPDNVKPLKRKSG